jgi:hypothetical protein
MKRIYLNIFLCLVGSFVLPALAQTPQKIEQELVKQIKEVEKYSTYGSNYDDEKLSQANDVFEKNLLKYTKMAATLSYRFPAFNKLIQIATSDDGRFRIYSWDMQTGGTMHDYARVYQYAGADGRVYSKTDEPNDEEGGAGSFVYAIYQVGASNGKVYVVCSTFIGSTQDHYGSANLYKIEGSELIDKIKLFKTVSGLTDSIGFEYNFFSVADRPDRPLKLVLFDKKTNILKIPVVINDKEFPNGRVTKRFINYKFNGTNFVKVS